MLEDACESRQLPTQEDVLLLISLLPAPSATPAQHRHVASIFTLLSRWTRQLSMHRAIPQQNITETLHQSIYRALNFVSQPWRASLHPTLLLFLGTAASFIAIASAANANDVSIVERIIETAGTALLSIDCSTVPPADCSCTTEKAASDFLFGCTYLISASAISANVSSWVSAAFFQASALCLDPHAVHAATQAYPAFRQSIIETYDRANVNDRAYFLQSSSVFQEFIEGLYGNIRSILLHALQAPCEAQVAVLAAGGMLDGLSRLVSGRASMPQRVKSRIQLVIDALASLMAEQAAIAVNAYGLSSPHDRHNIACIAYAISQSHRSCTMPHPTPQTAICLVIASYYFLFKEQQQQRHVSEIVSAAKTHAAIATMDETSLSNVLHVIRSTACTAHEHYRNISYSQAPATAPYLQNEFASCQKLFVISFRFLDVLASTPYRPRSPRILSIQLPATVASVAADLQFCRTDTAEYSSLVKLSIKSLTLDSYDAENSVCHTSAAAVHIAGCLPLYNDAIKQSILCTGDDTKASAAWLYDAVLAAKVQFLFALLSSCCGYIPQVRMMTYTNCLLLLELKNSDEHHGVYQHESKA